jgi:hypothetical protein
MELGKSLDEVLEDVSQEWQIMVGADNQGQKAKEDKSKD